jgi:hypothetical protein
MWFRVVTDLICHAWLEDEVATILKFGSEFSVNAEKHMAFDTPVVGQITRRVLNHPNTDTPEIPSAPVGQPTFTFVLGPFDLRPVGCAKRNLVDFHSGSF